MARTHTLLRAPTALFQTQRTWTNRNAATKHSSSQQQLFSFIREHHKMTISSVVPPFVPDDVPPFRRSDEKTVPGARPLLPASTSGTAQQLTNHQTHLVSAPFNLPTNEKTARPLLPASTSSRGPRPRCSLVTPFQPSDFQREDSTLRSPSPSTVCLDLWHRVTTTNHTYLSLPRPLFRANPCVDRVP